MGTPKFVHNNLDSVTYRCTCAHLFVNILVITVLQCSSAALV